VFIVYIHIYKCICICIHVDEFDFISRERAKFIIRQPPIGKIDDYDSENSWISLADGLPSSSKEEERRWEGGGGRVEREVKCKISTIMGPDFSVPIKPITRLVLKENSSL